MNWLCSSPPPSFGGCNHPKEYIRVHYNEGQETCTRCGLVLEKLLFENPHTAYMDTVQEPHPDQIFIPSSHVSTRAVSGATRAQQMVQRESFTENKTMKEGFKIIEGTCKSMKIVGNIVTCSKEIYRDVVDAKKSSFYKGKHFTACALACVFGACRVERFPRPISALVKDAGSSINERDVEKIFRDICRLLSHKTYASALTATDCDMISIFMQHAGIGARSHPAITKRARAISNIVKEKSILESKAPEVLCGSIVAMALQEANMTFDIDTMADVCNVSVNVINTTVRELTCAIP